jgi:hypothetical protein
MNAPTGSTSIIDAHIGVNSSTEYEFVLSSPDLIHQGFRCVTGIFVDRDPELEDGDQGSQFCLGAGDCFQSVVGIPTPVTTPTPTPTPLPVVTPPVGQPPVVAPPGSTGERRSLTTAQARSEARRALRRAYKRQFTGRTRESYRMTCRRKSATRQTCRVSWRRNKYRYSGRVIVRLRRMDNSYATTVMMRRNRRL